GCPSPVRRASPASASRLNSSKRHPYPTPSIEPAAPAARARQLTWPVLAHEYSRAGRKLRSLSGVLHGKAIRPCHLIEIFLPGAQFGLGSSAAFHRQKRETGSGNAICDEEKSWPPPPPRGARRHRARARAGKSRAIELAAAAHLGALHLWRRTLPRGAGGRDRRLRAAARDRTLPRAQGIARGVEGRRPRRRRQLGLGGRGL